MRRRAQLLERVGDRHVVEPGRAEQPVEVVVVAEDRRAELGVVGADALEDAGAVVEAVREYVDLGVLPGDEVSVHPDEVGLVHVNLLGAVRARPGWPRPSWPPRPGPGCEDRQRARDRPRILERRPPPA